MEATLMLSARLGERLRALGWHITTAESCTGGGVSQAITAIPGSSLWFESGFVTYANSAKTRLLGVAAEALAAEGAVSEIVARQMAVGALDAAQADLAVAITGVAGPDGGSPAKPVGTVWFAWATRNDVRAQLRQFSGDRAQVRAQAVAVALQGALDMLD